MEAVLLLQSHDFPLRPLGLGKRPEKGEHPFIAIKHIGHGRQRAIKIYSHRNELKPAPEKKHQTNVVKCLIKHAAARLMELFA